MAGKWTSLVKSVGSSKSPAVSRIMGSGLSWTLTFRGRPLGLFRSGFSSLGFRGRSLGVGMAGKWMSLVKSIGSFKSARLPVLLTCIIGSGVCSCIILYSALLFGLRDG